MTSTTETDVCSAFVKRAKERLLKPGALQPPFEGPWCVALDAQLKVLVGSFLDSELSLLTRVVNCFYTVPVDAVEALFVALRDAVAKVPPRSDDELHWLNELACFAFIRTLQPDFLFRHLQIAEGSKAARVGTALMTTNSALMASMAYTQLISGLRFDGAKHRWSESWLEVRQFSDQSDAVEAILSAVIDHDCDARGVERRNPDVPLTDHELRRWLVSVRARYGEAHIKGKASGLCVLRPRGIPDDQWAAILEAVAGKLKTVVLGFERQGDANMTRPESLLTPEDLDYQLGLIFNQIVAAPSSQRKPAPARFETEGWEFDFFLSHASEDKKEFVDALSIELAEQGWRVWYDKEQLLVGDSLVKSIDHGLSRSRYVVFVVSADSLKKSGWVEAEWEAVLNRQTSLGELRVLPVWLNVSPKEGSERHPLLARFMAADGSKGVADVVLQLQKRAKRGEARK